MTKPRIFLGSSGQQAELLESLTAGLQDVADVEPWTIVFNPGTSTLERLVELTGEVDFAAFIFAQDDWTSHGDNSGMAAPRDNVVFEAGLFGGVIGMRRTFILHAEGAKLPTDLLGLTCVRYSGTTPGEVDEIVRKLRTAMGAEGRLAQIDGLWWQHSLTLRTEQEPSAVSLLRISRDRRRGLQLNGAGWQQDGTLSVRYHSVAARELRDPSGIFYYWNGERPRHPDAPRLEGTAEIRLESADRATGYWITRSDKDPLLNTRTSGVYLRADPADAEIMDGNDPRRRAGLIASKLDEWLAISNS
ncbi:TIR domain-containing protein [Microlunatus parietis]|uniref:CD-NTase-associated protein 12/Pycsar effector protein TIR domain-containing protein n=1 Tax=Microlunatus parietis TaxID=682979 RepID=A0A7Y9LAN8_9ACTN|nr:TIR domain-containing protein [Microlunatus parietis]NYE68911.1 hypothetical protein [Microlunatus parietis]